MARLLIAVLFFVGLATALPTLNLRNEKVKEVLDGLKQANFNRLTNRAQTQEKSLDDLTRELESFLKKREGGQTIQEDRAQDKRGQGQGHDPCRDVPENPVADLTRYKEENHWMHFLCNLRSVDPSEAFADLIGQMVQATDILMNTMNECTAGASAYTDADLASLETLAREAYEAGKEGQEVWEDWSEFDDDTKLLFAKYEELEDKGMDAAHNSQSWTAVCTDMVTGLDRTVGMLNTAAYMYKLHILGWV